MTNNMKIKKKKAIIKFILCIISLIFVVCGIKSCNKENLNNDNNINHEINSGEKENGLDNNIKKAKGVAIPGWESITIASNTKKATVEFYNPEANMNMFYLTFELRLLGDNEDGYEVLYKSKMLEPGEKIQEIDLSRELEIGEYNAIIHVQPYRMDEEKTPTNNAEMKIKLVVN